MKNKSWIPAVIVIVLIIGAVVVLSGGSDETASNSQSTTQNGSGQSQNTGQSSTGIDRYVPYSNTALADNSDTQRVLFFHATWCTVCNAFEREIEAQGVPEGVTIVKANYDRETALKSEYGVTVQSTFILLDDSGQEVRRWPFGQGLSGISDLYDQVQSS